MRYRKRPAKGESSPLSSQADRLASKGRDDNRHRQETKGWPWVDKEVPRWTPLDARDPRSRPLRGPLTWPGGDARQKTKGGRQYTEETNAHAQRMRTASNGANDSKRLTKKKQTQGEHVSRWWRRWGGDERDEREGRPSSSVIGGLVRHAEASDKRRREATRGDESKLEVLVQLQKNMTDECTEYYGVLAPP